VCGVISPVFMKSFPAMRGEGCYGSQGMNIMLPHHMTKPLHFTGSMALVLYTRGC